LATSVQAAIRAIALMMVERRSRRESTRGLLFCTLCEGEARASDLHRNDENFVAGEDFRQKSAGE
jgi:hypothetical protein